MPEKLLVNCLCNRISVPALDHPQLSYILTELTAKKNSSMSRIPLNLAFIIDSSDSINEENLETIKQNVCNFIEQLQPRDTFSLIQLGRRVRTIIPAQKVKDVEKMKRQVERMKCSGKIKITPGINESIKQLRRYPNETQLNSIILLLAGMSEDDDLELAEIADQAGKEGFPIIGLGYGRDWNEDVLASIVDRSNQVQPGSYKGTLAYIPKKEEIEEVFEGIFQNLEIVARNVKINMGLMRGVQVRQMWQVKPIIKKLDANTLENSIISIDVGDLEKVGIAFLVEVVVPQRAAGPIRIAQTEVVYNIPGQETQKEIADLVVNFSQDLAVTNPLDSYVMDFVEAAQVFRLQTEALRHTEEGDVQSAIPKLRQAAAILISQGETALADQMRAEADYYLRQFGQISREGKRAIRVTSRKMVKNIGSIN